MKFTANTLALQKAIMPFTELETNLFSAMELNLKSDLLTISARGGSVKIKSELPVSDCEDGTVVVSFETFLPSIGIIKSENVTVESKCESLLFSFDDKSVEIDTVNGDVVERIDIENKVPSVELTGKDMDFAKYADLSEAQKTEFLELAEILVACSTKGRNEGLLAIDEYVSALKTETKGRLFLKKMLTYVVDGVDSTIIRQIGENYLFYDDADSFGRFTLDMVLTGVLSIQLGDNPWILMEKIASFTGIVESGKFIEKLLQKKDEYEKKHPISSQNENILYADFNAGEEGGTISQDEIDALLGGTPAENTQD